MITSKQELKDLAKLAAPYYFKWIAQNKDGEWWAFYDIPYFDRGYWLEKSDMQPCAPICKLDGYNKPKADSHITIRVNRYIKAAIKAAAARQGLSITDYLLSVVGGTVDYSKQVYEVTKLLTDDQL